MRLENGVETPKLPASRALILQLRATIYKCEANKIKKRTFLIIWERPEDSSIVYETYGRVIKNERVAKEV